MESTHNFSVENTVEELALRWKKAREASFYDFLKEKMSEDHFFTTLNQLSNDVFDQILSQVFLNSRNLGKSYQKNFNVSWERIDLVQYLTKLHSPCLVGHWLERSPTASVLTRSGCHSGRLFGHRHCQYWREAIDGLITGICDLERLARHQSITSGDENCVDIFYSDEETPTDSLWNNPYRWGEIPNDKKLGLSQIENKFEKMKVKLSFLGISENNLYYKLESKENLTCGTSGTLYRTMLENILKKHFPELVLKDASPVAVYGEKT